MTASCFHCGEAIPKDLSLSVRYLDCDQPVCCVGCQSVAEMILQSGMAAYYEHRETPAVKPGEADASWLAYDQPEFYQSFVRLVGDQHQVSLLIPEITCSACAWLIEKRLSVLEGVRDARVNASAKRLDFKWDCDVIALSDVLKHIDSIGYTGQGWNSENAADRAAQALKSLLFKVGLAGIAFLQVMMFAVAIYTGGSEIEAEYSQLMRWFSLVISLPVVLYSAKPFFSGAYRALKARSLTMDVPIATAIGLAWSSSIIATVTASGEVYYDSVVMFTFFLLTGRYLEQRAQHREREAMYSLNSWLPKTAIKVIDGKQTWIPIQSVVYGDRLLVRVGDSVPADGVVRSGSSSLDEALFSGEHLPVEKALGDTVYAGTVNIEREIEIEVTASNDDTEAAAINQLLNAASAQKPPITQLVDRISGVFIASVLSISAASYLVWSLLGSEHAFWIALSVLVVTCPCALSLATPVAITSAIAGLRQRGVLVTNSAAITVASKINVLMVDKTGTLTKGDLRVERVVIHSDDVDEAYAMRLASTLEQQSNHPISKAFDSEPLALTSPEVVVGGGVSGDIEGVRYAIGSASFTGSKPAKSGSICLTRSGVLIAEFEISDTIREGAMQMVKAFVERGVEVVLCSGDAASAVKDVATRLGISTAHAEMKPEDKYGLLKALRAEGKKVCMVGDGLNDVPVLGGADVSIAVSSGASLARCHADFVVNSEAFTQLPDTFLFLDDANRTILQNLGWALLYNAIALPLAVLGFVPPWAAAIGMSLSSLVVVLNALKLSR